MSFVGTHACRDLPVVRLEVLNAGPMVGIGLELRQAMNRAQTKTHQRYHPVVEGGGGKRYGVGFGFDPEVPDVGSNQAQAGSVFGSEGDRVDFYGSDDDVNLTEKQDNSDSPERFSPVGSIDEPPALSDNGASPPSVFCYSRRLWCIGRQPPRSTHDTVIRKRVEGKPQSGRFNIQTVNREELSTNAFAVFELPVLHEGLTLGDLTRGIGERGMEPFFLRELGGAMFGCRDFM